jgi:hypothetical protein
MHIHRGGAAGLKQQRWTAPEFVDLLGAETDGLAIDFTQASPMVQVRTSSVDVYSEPDAFFTYTGDGKVVKVSSTLVGAVTFPISYGEGLLIEVARTNILLQSEDFTTTWTNTNSSESSNATTAPDGTSTADKLIEASDVGQDHSINQTSAANVTTNTTYTFSCYLKAAERTWARLSGATTRFADNFHCDFNLGTGVKGTVGAGATSSGIEDIGSGWYRCWIGANCDSTGTNVFSITIGEGDTDVTYDGDGSSGIYVWGAQVAAAGGATVVPTSPRSYIPTTTAAVTRAIDVVTVATSDYPHSATAGTVYVDIVRRDSLLLHPTSDPRYWMLHDGTLDETIACHGQATGTDEQMTVADGGVTQAAMDISTDAALGGVRTQLTVGWAANNFNGSVDGGAVPTPDTSGTLPTVTTLQLGDRFGNDRNINGFIRRFIYVPRRVTDGDLPTWRYNF